MKIPVIEDEKMLADSIRSMPERKGFQVECVYDGESGKEYAKLGIYDLLILHVMIPKLDGFEVARQVRKNRCSTPILMLTARSDVQNRLQYENCIHPRPRLSPGGERILVKKLRIKFICVIMFIVMVLLGGILGVSSTSPGRILAPSEGCFNTFFVRFPSRSASSKS